MSGTCGLPKKILSDLQNLFLAKRRGEKGEKRMSDGRWRKQLNIRFEGTAKLQKKRNTLFTGSEGETSTGETKKTPMSPK